jgi:hypothetical protein
VATEATREEISCKEKEPETKPLSMSQKHTVQRASDNALSATVWC